MPRTQDSMHGLALRYQGGCVAADHAAASEAGAAMLRAGGNAVDAAVAASFALSVVRPYSCGIGGGGFMLIYLREQNRTIALDYRETAPAGVGPGYFATIADAHASERGVHSVGVPGTVFGLLHALERFGTMPRDAVIAPAIALAHAGFLIDAHYHSNVQEVIGHIRADGVRTAQYAFVWERFLWRGDAAVGDRITLPEQARALELLVERGADAFRDGPLADAIVACVSRGGGALTHKDLAAYRIAEREPLSCEFLGSRVIGFPLPSSAGVVGAQVLGMLARRADDWANARRDQNPLDADYLHLLCEACQHAFADRAHHLGDTDEARAIAAKLLDATRITAAADTIDMHATKPASGYGTLVSGKDGGGTSHLCAVDRAGNAVACTETINQIFGSLVTVDGFGFVLNDTLDDFATRPLEPNAFGLVESIVNTPAPGKRPLSCMMPTIVLDAPGNVRLVAGGSGGPRIISSTLQVLLNVLAFGMDVAPSVASPRVHHQWTPKLLQMEPTLRAMNVAQALERKGHVLSTRDPVGTVQCITRDAEGWAPACDHRKGGVPAGIA